MGRDLATAGITLSALKLSGWGARSLMGRVEGNSAFASFSRAALPQVATLGGLMLGHRMEEGLGLRPHVDGATTFVDSLSTLLVFHVSGRLLHHAMGPNYAALQREMEWRSQVLARTSRPRGETGDRPPLADLLTGMFAAPRPALAGAGVREGRGARPFRLPHILMMSNEGENGGGGRRSSSPPSADDAATTLKRPISPRPVSPEEAERMGRADTVMRGPEIVAPKPEAERVPETVLSEADPKTQLMPPAGDPVVAALRPPPLPREAAGAPKETEIEVAPEGVQTGVYDPRQLQAQRAAAVPADPTNLVPGNRLGPGGRYEVVRHLGGGGMGDVWEVMDRELGRAAVIKIPKAGLFEPEHLRRFDREVKIGANLDVRFVVPVYDVIEMVAGGLRVPVMRYVPGRDLHSILYGITRENPEVLRDFPAERRLELFAKLCEAVDSIHEDGIVHRDLKPANVRVTPEGNVLLMDFGLAKRQADGTNGHDSDAPDSPRSRLSMPARSVQAENITQAGVWQGTVGYIAPETLFSKPLGNFRSPDIFALGVMLYESMTGLHPFATYRNGDPALGEPARVPAREIHLINGVEYQRTIFNPHAPILWSHPEQRAKVEPPAFREVSSDPMPDFVYELERVARKAMDPDPAARYQTAREMMHDVLLAPARTEYARLSQIRTVRMAEIERQMQEAWSKFTIASQLNPDQWTEMKRTIRERRHLRSAWRQGLRDIVTSIIETTRGNPWPEAKKMIARASYELLVDGGDRMDSAERNALRETVRRYDVAIPNAELEADRIDAYRQALEGAIPLNLRAFGLEPGNPELAGASLRVTPFERIRETSGEELDTFREGAPIASGSMNEVLSNLRLRAGYYVFEVSHPGYQTMRVPMEIGLENIRHGILGSQRLALDLELVPSRALEPKNPADNEVERLRRQKEMVVVHRGPATIGIDFDYEGAPDHFYSAPKRSVYFDTFLVSRDPVTVGEYVEFIEDLLRQGRREEAQRHIPRATNPAEEKRLNPFQEYRRLRREEKMNMTTAVKHLFSTWSGFTYSWKIVSDRKGGYRLDNPIGQMDARNDPIMADQPISSIDLDSARAYAQWRAERDGLPYRMIRPEENEKLVRGSLPLTYPWGYENDPNAVASRLAHSNMEDIYPLPVGTHPRGAEWHRDFTLYGTRDNLGNVREFTVDDRLPTLAVMAGGSVRTPLGPYYLPPGRAYLHKGVAEDGSGTFRLVLDGLELLRHWNPSDSSSSGPAR